MGSFIKLFDRRAKLIVAAFAMLLGTIVPALVSADQVTTRSIELSSSSTQATNVTYTVNFTPVHDAEAFIVDFCTVTPLYGEDCTTPAGFNVGSLSAVPAGFTSIAERTNDTDHNTLRVTGSMTAGTPVSAVITGITNPTAAGTIYARIVTFDTEAHADSYVSNPVEPAVNDGMVDNGGVALSITPTVGVSGAVLESMTFCAASAVITVDCANAAANLPTVKLGTTVGDATVLDSADTYEGTIYTQISTNAASGAIVSLKSNTLGCGGLARAGAPSFAEGCGIAPALAGGVADGQAKFGVKVGTAAAAAGAPASSGTLRAYHNVSDVAYYDDTTFKMNWVSGDGTGVTSTYGDPFLDTNSLPVNNMGMPIIFGASAANNTPAGRYSADLSLIATGKF